MGMHEYLKSLSDLEMINRAPGNLKNTMWLPIPLK